MKFFYYTLSTSPVIGREQHRAFRLWSVVAGASQPDWDKL